MALDLLETWPSEQLKAPTQYFVTVTYNRLSVELLTANLIHTSTAIIPMMTLIFTINRVIFFSPSLIFSH